MTSEQAAAAISLLSGSLPSYAVGTPYVPRDMVAQIHKGEAIIPASENGISQTSGNGDVVINFNGPVYGMLDFAQQVKQIVRDTARDGGFRGVLASG